MKKLFCFCLCLIFVFSLCACVETKKSEDTVDLEYFVRNGKINEAEFNLGTKADDITAKLDASVSGQNPDQTAEEPPYSTVEKNGKVGIVTDMVTYFYDKNDKEKKINYIVSYNGACGFNQGDLTEQITAKLAKSDLNAKPEDLSAEETFFFPVTGAFKGIKYSYGENTLCFMFGNNQLCACALYKN